MWALIIMQIEGIQEYLAFESVAHIGRRFMLTVGSREKFCTRILFLWW